MKTSTLIGAAACTLGILILAAGFVIYKRSFEDFEHGGHASSEVALQVEHRYGVEIQGQPTTPSVLTDVLSHRGEVGEVACASCHTTRSPNVGNHQGDDLDTFHQGLVVKHGDLSCLSCHNDANYDTLKLADGTAVGFEHTMQLCAQCHGPQSRDYQNGSHGGMNGYWDLSRGPRTRNACTVCHDAHAPAYPQLMPVFAPTDIVPPKDDHHAAH